MERTKKTPPRVNVLDRIGTSVKPTVQMSGQSYTTPVNTGHRNHPVQKIMSTSGNASQRVSSNPINTRLQTPGILRQPVNQTAGSETPGSTNSQNNYLTPGNSTQNYSTPSQHQDHTFNFRHQDNYSFDETSERQIHGILNPSVQQTVNEALHATSQNIEKLRALQHQVEARIDKIKDEVDEIRNRVEEALILPQQQEIRIDLVQQLKEINTLEADLHEQRLMMKMVERQLHEHAENQKQLELAECNFQMKKRQFESELQKNREDFQKQQRYRDESYYQQQQKMEEKNDTIAEMAKTMPEVSEIERTAEKTSAAKQTVAAAEAPVRDTENRRKAEGIPKVRFRGDCNELNK